MASIVIPTKDEEKIFTALERARIQEPEEIIVVNDSESSENYSDRLKQLEYINYIEAEGGGPARARNLGAEEATSDKIIFLDADCYPTEDWLKKIEEALKETEIAEGEIEYIGKRCRFSRVVENRGETERFLTANLGVRKQVFEEIKFDEGYGLFREDTDFGFRALNAGHETQFINAKVEHDAGKLDLKGFIEDQLRYVNEPYFVQKFKGDEKLGQEVRKIGPVLYPIELGLVGLLMVAFALSIIVPPAVALLVALMIFISTVDTMIKVKSQKIRFCLKDWLKGSCYIPIGLLAKRYVIWKGAYKDKVRVI